MINRPISTHGVLLWRTVARFAIGTLMLGDGISLTGEAWGRSRICMFSMQQALLLCCMIWSVLPLDGIELKPSFELIDVCSPGRAVVDILMTTLVPGKHAQYSRHNSRRSIL